MIDINAYIAAATLYDITTESESKFLTARKPASITTIFRTKWGVSLHPERASALIDYLIANKVISIVSDPLASDYYTWSKVVSKRLFDKYANDTEHPFRKAAVLGHTWIKEVLDNVAEISLDSNPSVVTLNAPASDRIVSINHNSAQWVLVREKIDELDNAIRADNSTSIESTEEKERIRQQIDAGKKIVSVKNVSLAAISATLIAALKYLSKKFGDEAIGQLAERLLDAVLKAF